VRESVTVRKIAPVPWRPLTLGLLVGGSGLIVALAVDALLPWAVLAAGLVYALGAVLIGASWRRSEFGAANGVTLARLVGCCWIGALTVEAALRGLSVSDRVLLIALATACLVLDGVDGWVARELGEVSDFGARFDVETDAVLLLCLSLVVPILGVVGWWAVLLSGMRYGYLLLSWTVPALQVPPPATLAGKVVAVISAASLIAALTVDLVLPGWPAGVPVLFGLACLVWSFGRSIVWQARQYRTRPEFARFGPI
jgi:phosphatidylglycerophosphate synthase